MGEEEKLKMQNLASKILLLTGNIFCQENEGYSSSEQTDIVYTGSGPVRGFKINKYGMDLYGFLGIPYAKPPIGKLRFKPPVPVTPWSDVFDAYQNGPQCLQPPSPLSEPFGETSEDCLTLNVFTNNVGFNGLFRKQPQAVM